MLAATASSPDQPLEPKTIDVTDPDAKVLRLYELGVATLKYCLSSGKDKPRPKEMKADDRLR